MKKRLKTVIPETQQEITTTVERDDDEVEVTVRTDPKLDDDVYKQFCDDLEDIDQEGVTVSPKRVTSNQGNILSQEVTVQFNVENRLNGLEAVDWVVTKGRERYSRQLERKLVHGEPERELIEQHRLYDDPAIEEFCTLYLGRLKRQE